MMRVWGGSPGGYEQICLLSIFMTHYHKLGQLFSTIVGYTGFRKTSTKFLDKDKSLKGL